MLKKAIRFNRTAFLSEAEKIATSINYIYFTILIFLDISSLADLMFMRYIPFGNRFRSILSLIKSLLLPRSMAITLCPTMLKISMLTFEGAASCASMVMKLRAGFGNTFQ